MSPRSEYEPEPMGTGLIIGTAISILLVVAGLAWTFSPTSMLIWDPDDRAQYRSGVEFPEFQIDGDELERARAEFAGDPDLDAVPEAVEGFTSTYRQLNRQQFDHPPGQLQRIGSEASRQWEELETVLEHRATDITRSTGPEGFQRAGEPVFEACLEGLEQLLDAVRADDVTIDQALNDPPPDRFASYRDNCGTMLRDLVRRFELVDDNGQWQRPDGPELVDLLQRYRWIQILRGKYHPRHDLMSSAELGALYRWRIEDPDAFSPAQRRQYLRDGRAFLPDDYDVALAEARIDAAAAETPEQVRQRFEALVEDEPDNLVYRAILENL